MGIAPFSAHARRTLRFLGFALRRLREFVLFRSRGIRSVFLMLDTARVHVSLAVYPSFRVDEGRSSRRRRRLTSRAFRFRSRRVQLVRPIGRHRVRSVPAMG